MLGNNPKNKLSTLEVHMQTLGRKRGECGWTFPLVWGFLGRKVEYEDPKENSTKKWPLWNEILSSYNSISWALIF